MGFGFRLGMVCVSGMAVVWCTVGAAQDPPSPTLTVQVEDGRTYTALVDSKTDDKRLWLRFEEGTAVLWRPVTWSRIQSASFGGQQVELENLRRVAREIQSPRTVVVAPRGTRPERQLPEPSFPPPASLAFDAALGNWDGDVETDGLVLRLRVLDADGPETATAGTLEVELFAPRIRKYHEAPQSRGYRVDLIERWSVPIAAERFRRGEAVVRLPFGAIHPEFDRQVDSFGLVHVRLTAPGHGTFEQSMDGVPLRSFTQTRDAALDNSGRHYLPTEGTGRGKSAYPLPRY